MQNRLGVVLRRTAILIRLDSPNIRRLRPHKIFHQCSRACLDLVSSAGGPFLAIGVWTIWEQALKEVVARANNKISQVLYERILVLVRHPGNSVHHVSGIMFHQKLRATRLKMWVRSKASRALDE